MPTSPESVLQKGPGGSMHTFRDQIFGIVNPHSHNTQKLSWNGSEVILKWFNVRVNGEIVLRTVPIMNG